MLEIDDLDARNGQSLAEELATNPGKACRTVGGNQLQTARLIIRIYSSSALHCRSNSRSRGAGRSRRRQSAVHYWMLSCIVPKDCHLWNNPARK